MSLPGDVVNFDVASFLAHRAIEAAQLGPPKLPQHVVLPGAKVALEHDRLVAYQESGRDERAIVERINERWRSDHADVLAERDAWAAGPYREAIEQMRRAKMELDAENLRRRALLERKMAEWEVE